MVHLETYLEPSTNLFQTAQSLKGRPDIDSFSYLNYIPEGDEFEALVLNMTDISRFAYNNVSVTVNENTVATVVQLYDFRGQDAVSSERQLVVETGCQRFESNGRIDGAVHYELNGRNEAVPLWSANYTKFPIQELTIGSSHNPLRWIVKDSSRKPEICK